MFERLSVNEDGEVFMDGVLIAFSDENVIFLAEELRKEYLAALYFRPGMSLAERTKAAYAAFKINDARMAVLGMTKSGRELRRRNAAEELPFQRERRRLKMPSGYGY